MIEAQFEALAVETRRQIYAMLIERPRSVQELADELPVSRPAVSQHLKVLVEAGLARSNTVGTRRVYAADPAGVAEFRKWADRMWSEAIGRFADFATSLDEENEMLEKQMTIDPVVKTARLGVDPETAFKAFTASATSWWPLSTHSVGEGQTVAVTFEPKVGGRVFETTKDGVEHIWGTILTWEEGRRVEFTWFPGLPEDQHTRIEISFKPIGHGSEMILIHSGWEARGEDAGVVRNNYDKGWDFVLGEYADSL